MKKLAVLLCICMLAITGCSSNTVSEFDYTKAIEERDDYRAKYTQLLEEQKKQAEAQQPLSYADAWVKASFGQSAQWALVGDAYLQVIVPTGAALSVEQCRQSATSYQNSIKSLAGIYQVNAEHFTFSSIFVSFLDQNGLPMFTGQIRKGESGFEAGPISINQDSLAIVRDGFAAAAGDASQPAQGE